MLFRSLELRGGDPENEIYVGSSSYYSKRLKVFLFLSSVPSAFVYFSKARCCSCARREIVTFRVSVQTSHDKYVRIITSYSLSTSTRLASNKQPLSSLLRSPTNDFPFPSRASRRRSCGHSLLYYCPFNG